MDNRISSAYQQFSQQIQRQQNSDSVRQIERHQDIQPVQETPQSAEQQDAKVSTARKAQLKQLRETGTLENLRSILSEDEETLLEKLFPDQKQTYDRRGGDSQAQSIMQSVKGGFFDQKF